MKAEDYEYYYGSTARMKDSGLDVTKRVTWGNQPTTAPFRHPPQSPQDIGLDLLPEHYPQDGLVQVD